MSEIHLTAAHRECVEALIFRRSHYRRRDESARVLAALIRNVESLLFISPPQVRAKL